MVFGVYVSLVLVVGAYTALALWPPRRPRAIAVMAFFVSHLINELPGIALAALIVGTVLSVAVGAPTSPGDLVFFVLAGLSAIGLITVMRRGLAARTVVARAVETELGAGAWSSRIHRGWSGRRLARDLLGPFPVPPPGIRRVKNVAYGHAGRRNRLDVYYRRSGGHPGPVLVHFHGGHFQIGHKSREARALLFRLAGEGWLCISATYRLRAAGRFPHSLFDAKKVVHWAVSNASEYGGDPGMIIVSGSSAGAHLASMAALTANTAEFQPGFEDADTSVAAAVCLYGYYGGRDASRGLASSPVGWIGRDAPPFVVAHGENDPLIPVEHADDFVRRLREGSASPVVYFRIPGGEHSFDLFCSPRFDAVIEGVAAFGEWLRQARS